VTTRRDLLLGLGASLLVLPLDALAQPKDRVWRVGFLATRRRPEPLEADMYGEVPKGLRDLGYVEGKDLVIEWRFADGKYERLDGLAEELVRLPVDVIVTDGTPGTRAAQKATRTIPIVFAAAGDPVATGLVKSFAHPGGNVTGNSQLLIEASPKQMELMMTMIPRLTRLAVLWNPANANSLPNLKRLEATAPTVGVELLSLQARTPGEIEKAFAAMAESRSQAFIWIVDSFLIQELRLISDLAIRHRLPSVGPLGEYPAAGGLMSYGIKRTGLYRRAATYIDKILKGANPGDLPVEQPTTIELVVNRRTATTLGLKLSPELLLLADRVIE